MFTLDDFNLTDAPENITDDNTNEGLNPQEEETGDKGDQNNPKPEEITDPPKGDDTDQKDPPAKDPSEIDDDNISVFAKAFREEGLLTGLTEEQLKEINSLSDAVKYIKEEVGKTALDGLSPVQKRYIETLNAGIQPSEFEELEKDLKSIENITEESLQSNLEAQFTVIALNLIEKGVPSEEAQITANAIVKQPNAISKALEAREALYQTKLEKFNKSVEEKKEENRLSVEKTKELVESKDSILGKVNLTKADKEKILSKMVTRVDVIDGQQVNEFSKWRKENGVEAEFILNAIYTITDGFKSLGKLGTVAKNSAAKQLEEKLRQQEGSEITGSNFKIGENNPYNFNF